MNRQRTPDELGSKIARNISFAAVIFASGVCSDVACYLRTSMNDPLKDIALPLSSTTPLVRCLHVQK